MKTQLVFNVMVRQGQRSETRQPGTPCPDGLTGGPRHSLGIRERIPPGGLGQVGCRKERIYLEKVKRGAGRFAGRLKIYLFTIGGRGPLRAVKMLL